jgi:hypothetical protein
MTYDEKAKKMESVIKCLKHDNAKFTVKAFNSIVTIKECGYTCNIKIGDSGKYILESGNEFITLSFDDITSLMNTLYFLFHSMDCNKNI